MISLKHINSVARYERKTLFRSWFFKIFSILSLLILFSMNMGVFIGSGNAWSARAIPANLPYMNILFINVAMAIIAVFLASDFLRRDKKLDTSEVIYVRPLSNTEYVVGKTLGITTLFLGLILVELLMALVFNLVIKDTPVDVLTYLYYFLLIPVPTLVFILGLAFFLMRILKNQAVTYIVLLGYIGITLFFFKDKLNGLLDYMAFYLPMMYSDFTGFADAKLLVLQRLAYLLMGLSFIMATIRFLTRLPQSKFLNNLNLIGFIVLFGLGVYLGYSYFTINKGLKQDRENILSLNNTYAEKAVPDIINNDLDLKQVGNSLEISSSIHLMNRSFQSMDTLVFSLNPGFKIDSITGEQGIVPFVKEQQIVMLIPEQPLWPGQRKKYNFYYHGTPVESVANLDIDDERRSMLKSILSAGFSKKPAIIHEDYILLTAEMLWYPVAGVGFNTRTFQLQNNDFTYFSLSARARKGLKVIAPGEISEDEGVFHIRPEKSLNRFPLVIADLERKTLKLDEVEINLYLKSGHEYYTEVFPSIKDTLPDLIKEAWEEYDYDELDLYYPFKHINIIEVPVHYHAYQRPYTLAMEYVQPEMVFLPEKGTGLRTMDFKQYLKSEERRNRDWNRTTTKEEAEINLFKFFIKYTFFNNDAETPGGWGWEGQSITQYRSEDRYTNNPYCIFPMYYNYISGISSKDYPIFNTMIEQYLKEGYEVSFRESFSSGLSDNEKANMALRENSVDEILTNSSLSLINSTIYQAGSFIINALRNKVGTEDFDYFLYYYIEDHAHTEITFDRFAMDFYNEFQVDIRSYLSFLRDENKLPAFLISDPDYIETRDDYGTVYLVRFKITNAGNAKGLINMSFRVSGQGGFGGGPNMDAEERFIEIPPAETRDVQFVFYDQPRMLTINTLVSGNIPAVYNVFLRSAEEKNIRNAEDYVRESEDAVILHEDYEIVVDNEDPGFALVSVSNDSKLKQFVDSRKDDDEEVYYNEINPYWSPAVWTPVSHSGFYGELVRSGFVCRSGDGSNVATWSAQLPETGFYEVYVYIPVTAMYRMPSRNRRPGQGGPPEQGGGRGGRMRGPQLADKGTRYTYTVSSEEGSEEVEFILDSPEEGWNRLGSFHFPADTARVQLTNSTNGQRVIADAVKWVRR